MKWLMVLFWGMLSAFAGRGFYAFCNATYSHWFATTPLLHRDLQHDYFLWTGFWFAVFLLCFGRMVWLLIKGRGYTDQFRFCEKGC
jgi:hypothetical protein